MIKVNGNKVALGYFPNGESYIDIDFELKRGCHDINVVSVKFESDSDLLHLKFIKDYLDNQRVKATLEIPYMPYSRMDRQEEKRLFTLKSVATFINSMNFEEVIVWEPHSEVSIALIDRVKVKNTTHDLAIMTIRDVLGLKGSMWLNDKKEELFAKAVEQGVYLVYPDAGAAKRYQKEFKYPNVITCNKERDFNTGNITSLTLQTDSDLGSCKTAIIVDDLCSKGGTFILTSKVLKEKGINTIYLVVTHCENTIFDGDLFKTDYIKAVITTDSIVSKSNEKLIVVKEEGVDFLW